MKSTGRDWRAVLQEGADMQHAITLTWREARDVLDAIRAAKVEALQAQAREFREVAAGVWGGSSVWVTNGNNVADLAAGWCEDGATDYAEGDR